MKKIAIITCALCLMTTAAFAAEDSMKKPDFKNPPSKEEMAKLNEVKSDKKKK